MSGGGARAGPPLGGKSPAHTIRDVMDHAHKIIPNSLLLMHLTTDPGRFESLVVLASKLGVPVRLMTPISRLTLAAAFPGRAVQPAELAFEPKKSFSYNKTRYLSDPNEPKEPKQPRLQTHRSASFRHSPIQMGVPSSTTPQISSTSSSVTAIQPCVQSP